MEKQTEILDPKEFGLEKEKTSKIEASFTPKIIERDGLMEVYNLILTKEISKELSNEAYELRKKLVKVRTGIAAIHKTEKAFYLASGNYVDALKNKLTLPVEQMEERLSEIEKHFENLEKERLKKIHDDRVLKLIPFGYEIGLTDFSSMDENMFNAILVGAEKTHNDKIEALAKIEAERIEKERLEAEEREKQKAELERLRKEKEQADKILAEEKAKADAALKAEQEKAAKEKAEVERLAKIEAEKQAKVLAEQKAANDKLQAELKAKADAEAKIKYDQEKAEALRIAEEKKAAKAPDKQKLKVYLSEYKSAIIPVLKDDAAQQMAVDIMAKFSAFKKWANDQIETL